MNDIQEEDEEKHPSSTFFISVIIIAFNRKKFLFDALASVLNQTLDRSKYEIIVIKNFQDEKIDSLISENRVISLERGNEIVGSYIAAGVEKSRGEIVFYLDDDDAFAKEKLETVCKIFESDPQIGYYHNGIIPIDDQGKEIPIKLRKRTVDFVEKVGRFQVEKPITGSSANKLLRAAAYGYLSSIAVRKSVVVPYLSYLRNSIESAQDIFNFYCALLSPACKVLVIDPRRLTRYRMHEENVSLFSSSDRKGERIERSNNKLSKDESKKILAFLNREKRSLESIEEMAEETATTPANENGLKIVKKMIGYELYSRNVDLDMLDPSSNRRRVLSDAIKYLRYSFRSRFLRSQIPILGRSVLWVLSPNTIRRVFARRFASQGA